MRSRNFAGTLVAVPVEGFSNRLFHHFRNGSRAPKVALTLLVHASRQMAGAGLTVLGLAFCRQAKSLLRAFVCLLFGHIALPSFP